MDILIKGMEMPTSCLRGGCQIFECSLWENQYWDSPDERYHKRHPKCPLVSVPPQNKTNADRIRAMTDEELAKEMSVRLSKDCLMCPLADCPAWDNTKNAECKDAILDWLKQEVDNDKVI